MVRPDGYVKVLDFGAARQTFMASGRQNISSHAGLPVGTLRYMSPEQCRGDSATPASDVFAAGIILYEMIAGRHPFDADSPLDTAHAIAWSDPVSLRQWNPEVPSPIGALITRMLSKESAGRPLSAAAAEALALDGQSAGGRRSRRSLPFAAVLTIVLINVVLAAYWLRRPTIADNSTSDLRIAPLASLLGAERHPSVSPDGIRVAFVYTGDKDVKSHIYVKNLSDGALVRLTSGDLPDFQPVFSPDGTRLAFLRAFNGRLRIMVMPW
jgi:serine/threonine-protein kinase